MKFRLRIVNWQLTAILRANLRCPTAARCPLRLDIVANYGTHSLGPAMAQSIGTFVPLPFKEQDLALDPLLVSKKLPIGTCINVAVGSIASF